MRQSGRTSRIADFAIDQLYSVGECIVTDHIIFEYPSLKSRHLQNLIDKVRFRFEMTSYGNSTVSHEIIKMGKVPMVHFKIIIKKKDE
jgi:hypothetical protein